MVPHASHDRTASPVWPAWSAADTPPFSGAAVTAGGYVTVAESLLPVGSYWYSTPVPSLCATDTRRFAASYL